MTGKYNFIDYQKEFEPNIYFTIAVWLIMSQHQISPNWRKNIKKKNIHESVQMEIGISWYMKKQVPCFCPVIGFAICIWYLVLVIHGVWLKLYVDVIVLWLYISFDKTIISLRVLPYAYLSFPFSRMFFLILFNFSILFSRLD